MNQMWVLEINEGTVTILKEIEKIEGNEINVACEKLNSLWKEINFMQPITEEFNEYIKCVEDEKGSTNKIIRQLNNYLSAYKGFIDRWRTFLSRNKEKSYGEFFDLALSEIYDRCFEYRFIYNLRNYAQHAGEPVSSISRSFKGTKIILSKEHFITEHNGMQRSFKKELESMTEKELDVDNAIRVVHQELTELHAKLFNRQLNSLGNDYLMAAVIVLNFYKKYNKNKGEIALTTRKTIESLRELQEGSSHKTVNWSRIPNKLAETIIKGVYIKYKFKGKIVGNSSGFPFMYEQKLAIKMPCFETGSKYVEHNNLTWVQVGESTGTAWQDGYDRYFTIYMPVGLSMKEYNDKFDSFKKEIDEFFNRK
ncbi:hypothetical protein [Rossellomorea sp. DUT-2]|uniref:hypothetical protein n=1 Tax=Rossellomorea sp. DUT-2 TaxID=3412021 RepID=UPI003D175141